jgi:mannose-6-phosphate isomerase-like protein (cupin superfamily)
MATVPSLALFLLAVTSPMSHAQKAAKLAWGPAPAVFPSGAKMAVVSGDPTKAGPFTAQLSMPSGYRIPPHWHPTDEHVVVKRGTLLIGMGDTMTKASTKSMKALKAGESVDVKANMHHYAAAQGRTLIDVTAQGPFAMTYVNPADDPQTRTMAKSKGKAKGAKTKT